MPDDNRNVSQPDHALVQVELCWWVLAGASGRGYVHICLCRYSRCPHMYVFVSICAALGAYT